jgi:hypothetical protein
MNDPSTLRFILRHYRNFNARATREALLAYLLGARPAWRKDVTGHGGRDVIRAVRHLAGSCYPREPGATPNEKIAWDKLTAETPMFVIESTIVEVAIQKRGRVAIGRAR